MYLERLSDKVWLTRNARFTAAKRMKRSRVSSTAAVAMLSASVIAINLLAFLDESNFDMKIVTVGSIILSIFSFLLSLLIIQLRYEWREDNYNQCGMALEELNQKIRIQIDELSHENKGKEEIVSPREDNLKFLGEYTQIIQRYNLNHTKFDLNYGRLTDNKLKLSWWEETGLYIQYYLFDVYLIYWLVALVPVICTVCAFLFRVKG